MCNTVITRYQLERGQSINPNIELAYKQAASPIIPTSDPFTRLMIECDGDMAKLAAELARSGNGIAWFNSFQELVEKYHIESHVIGAGVNLQSIARGRAYQVLHLPGASGLTEFDFMSQYLSDILDKDPRYFKEGEWDADEILRRMRFYQGKMRGTAGWGFVDVQSPVADIFWEDTGSENSCEECPMFASLSPWSKETLYTTPGGCETPCLFECECYLRTEYGDSPKPVARKESD